MWAITEMTDCTQAHAMLPHVVLIACQASNAKDPGRRQKTSNVERDFVQTIGHGQRSWPMTDHGKWLQIQPVARALVKVMCSGHGGP